MKGYITNISSQWTPCIIGCSTVLSNSIIITIFFTLSAFPSKNLMRGSCCWHMGYNIEATNSFRPSDKNQRRNHLWPQAAKEYLFIETFSGHIILTEIWKNSVYFWNWDFSSPWQTKMSTKWLIRKTQSSYRQ